VEEEFGTGRGGEVRGSALAAGGVDGGSADGGRRGSRAALPRGGEESRRLVLSRTAH
jgi:hypothetical protein